ncbi:MAG: hypothetical protein JW863_02435 [Chitinispirillaceae bacterium]|nr:hypothetical protein [Chitinispirillaceae bacterium]
MELRLPESRKNRNGTAAGITARFFAGVTAAPGSGHAGTYRRVSDGSLKILACPDRGREIEELREQILYMVHDGTVSILNRVVVDRSCEFLPFAEVKKYWPDNLKVLTIANDLDSLYPAYHPYQSVFALTDARLPATDDQLQQLATERFAPMLDRLLIEGAAR